VIMQVAANFEAVKPFIITNYFGIYKWFLVQPPAATLVTGAAVLLAYGACFLAAGNYTLNRKDIMT